MRMHFRWAREDEPGARWRDLFERTWPTYSDWFLREGDGARPGLRTSRRRLREHMPELVPIWERLVDLAGGDELAARMLTLYRPTPYLAGCSQAVWSHGAPMLVRNYDYHPAACEGVFLMTSWSGTQVLASSDCLWGALDGMNEHGLVVALAFGGSRRVGRGFGIPLILRYVLQTCVTVADAAAALCRVPSHMAYNVSLLDATGAHCVARVAPGRPTVIEQRGVVTNHQDVDEWPEYVEATHSVEREAHLERCSVDDALSAEAFCELFLQPPLYATQFDRGMGTLYTTVYRPADLRVDYLWPRGRYHQSFADFREGEFAVRLVR